VGAAEIRVSSLVVDAGGGIDLGAGRITVAAGGYTTAGIVALITAGLFDSGIATAWWQGDINYDGFVDILDLSALLGSGLYDEASYLPSGLSAREAAFASHDASPPA
jgi:hypothetical protein